MLFQTTLKAIIGVSIFGCGCTFLIEEIIGLFQKLDISL